jgi:hypothetical protein
MGYLEPYIQCIYGIVGRQVTKYTVIYCVLYIHIRFWPILQIYASAMAYTAFNTTSYSPIHVNRVKC